MSEFADQSRIIFRLSGTGTTGATLRVYLQQFEADPARQNFSPDEVLGPLRKLAAELADIERFTGLTAPTAII